ncbi:MAG TPA: hypothetical protein VK509_19115, partial [Polyangiales bacterium]|nr:hypothetical protein [Polyangiales bacterium]
DVEKLRRHDFLNRAGLNVQRAALGSRCENITSAGKNRAEQSDPTKAGCWVAFGDGYLDSYGARVIADAVARLQIQFAMAIGKSLEQKDPAQQWLDECRLDDGTGGPSVKPDASESAFMIAVPEETQPSADKPFVRFEGEGVAHVHRCQLGPTTDGVVKCEHVTSGEPVKPPAQSPFDPRCRAASGHCRWLEVTAYSEHFDPQLAIRRCSDQACDNPRKIASNSDISQFDLQARTVFEAEEGAVYEIVVGNDGRTPRERGDEYFWKIADVSKAREPEPRCTAVLRAAELLDPAPPWAQTDEERKRRASWTAKQRKVWARYVVEGASKALEEIATNKPRDWMGECERRQSRCLSSGGRSAANAGVELRGVLGDPLAPCEESSLWATRSHPLCSTSGGVFDFGSPHASLWRPLIVIWPTPMGDITVIEGKDAFGKGMAVELVFGGGPTAQVVDDVGWAAALWLGVGLSYRVNNLFPYRENRSVLEANVAIQPVLSMVPSSRFLMAGFIEGRFPLVPFVLAHWFGTTSRYEFGPLGYRYYFQWPNRLPGGEGRFNAGHDIEFFNVSLGRGSGTRNREAGHILDPELRLRFGLFREWYLLGTNGNDLMPVLSAEFAWGHSTYFDDL